MSSINTTSINANYPQSGVNNSTQGFRDNFAAIKNNFVTTKNEITALETDVTTLQTTIDSLQQPDTAEVLSAVSGSDTITATSIKNFTAYTAGQRFQFRPSAANTTLAVTLNVNGRGAQSIKFADGTGIPVGTLTTNSWVTVEYNGSDFVLLSNIGFTQNGTNATTRTVQNKLSDVVSVKDFGAIGNGIANDTAAIQYALNTGKNVVGVPGETYLIGPLTQSTTDQVIDFTGCTLKRVNSSAHAAMLTLSGDRAKVMGGRWDGNKANQSGTPDNQYQHAAVTLTGDYTVVEGVESFNSWGLGLKAQSCSYTSIRNNRCFNSEYFEIYVATGTTDDEFGNEIVDNYISSNVVSPFASGGIYITGTNDFVRNQYYWKICRNTVQLSQNPSVTGVCITTRALDGVCNDNVTTGGTMGISGDIAQRTTFSGNRCSDTSGLSNYGIEINNQLCTVIGNVIDNTRYGISVSGTQFNQLYTTITGNVIRPQSGGIGIFAFSVANGVKTITGATSANPIQFTSVAHGLSGGVKSISGATSANPISFTTSSPHYFTNGDTVRLVGLPGAFAALNGSSYTITVTGASTFTVAVNGSGFAAYTSGGTATPSQNFVTFTELPGNFSALNGNSYPVTVTSANTFTVAVNGSTFAGYTSGGAAVRGMAQYLNITGNTIKFNGPSPLTGNGGAGIYLQNDTRYVSIKDNVFVGPGQTIPNGVGVYLDGTGGYCQIIGNRFASFERPAICYSGGAVTFTDITFNNNDCSYDCPQADNLLVTSGGAVFGARVTQMFNNTSNVNGFQINVFDKSNARQFSFNDGFPTPEGNVAAAMGSIWSAGGYGEGNTLYIKETGGNTNTGWIPVNSAYATFAQLNDAANAINTQRKRYGRLVTDTTNNRQYFAGGATASDPWFSLDGTQILTPGSGLSGRNVTLGALNITNTSARISGDFSNTTHANRVMFQTSTANGNTAVSALPNGTGTTGAFVGYNTNDPANASIMNVACTSTDVRLSSSAAGTGSTIPVKIFVGGAEQAAFGGGNSSMRSLGSFGTGVPVTVNAATYSVLVTDYSIRFTTTNCTVTLPSAATFIGRILILLTVTANSVTSNASNVVPLGSNTAGTAILPATAGKFAMLQSDGSLWYVLMAN